MTSLYNTLKQRVILDGINTLVNGKIESFASTNVINVMTASAEAVSGKVEGMVTTQIGKYSQWNWDKDSAINIGNMGRIELFSPRTDFIRGQLRQLCELTSRSGWDGEDAPALDGNLFIRAAVFITNLKWTVPAPTDILADANGCIYLLWRGPENKSVTFRIDMKTVEYKVMLAGSLFGAGEISLTAWDVGSEQEMIGWVLAN